VCALCGQAATEVHHRRGRVGANLLDESTWLPVDAECHRDIHANPAWAYEQGYLLHKDEK